MSLGTGFLIWTGSVHTGRDETRSCWLALRVWHSRARRVSPLDLNRASDGALTALQTGPAFGFRYASKERRPEASFETAWICKLLTVGSFLYWASCIELPVLSSLYWAPCIELPVLSFLYWASCIELPVLSFLYWASCIELPVLSFLYWAPCIELPVLSFLYWASCIELSRTTNKARYIHSVRTAQWTRYKNQLVNVVWGNNCCLSRDPHKTHKDQVAVFFCPILPDFHWSIARGKVPKLARLLLWQQKLVDESWNTARQTGRQSCLSVTLPTTNPHGPTHNLNYI